MKTKIEYQNKIGYNSLKWIGILFAFLGLIVVSVFLFRLFKFDVVFWSENIDFDTTSSIGSFIGGVAGALWSLTGVILFYLALRLQTQQLELQKVEIQATRALLSDQQFENKFFNLLNVQKGILENIGASIGFLEYIIIVIISSFVDLDDNAFLLKFVFIIFTFVYALIISWILKLRKKEKLKRKL